jgi:hypothetical protein
MVSGNPPRRSKPNDEPVTIDLEAEKNVEAETSEISPERDPSDPESTSANEVEIPLDEEKEPRRDAAGPADETPASNTAFDTAADEPAPQREQPAYSEASAFSEAAASPQRQQAATSGLIAAGILGGLIALIGAGAIQYAGLWPGAGASKETATDIAALNAEIDGLKRSVANLASEPAAVPDTALAARVATLETTVANNASTSNGAGSGDADQKITALSGEIDQLRASLDQAAQGQASADADMSKRLEAAEGKLSGPSQESMVARAIAAAGLKAAIDRGGPFQPELDTYANVAPDDPAVADLKDFARTGVPSRADLIRRVTDIANVIVGSIQQDDTDQGFGARLMAGAKSLVQVRPVGNVQGDSVEAIAARFEEKVKNGDLPGAVTEWNSLPDAAKSASAAFKQSLEARIRVEDLVGEALSKAIASTGKQD